jgi:hypothetical protein
VNVSGMISFEVSSMHDILYLFIFLQVAVGLVVALDYKNPYLNIYEEFQVSILDEKLSAFAHIP